VHNHPHRWLEEEIASVVRTWGISRNEDFWRTPLVAVASAEDPLLAELRRVVAPDHALPDELLPGARAVIVFFLPFKQWLGEANDREGFFAARSWAQAYVSTNLLIREINTHLQHCLEEQGYEAATTPATHNFDEERLISRWSHKHLAFVAGLGTFGCHHLLITSSGCCGRLGSLVTNMVLAPTPRFERELCLFKAGLECNACVEKCAYEALSTTGFDRHRCYAQCLQNDRRHTDLPLVDVCGKCGCEVPCSYVAPVSSKNT
jgi:epoxyqueuosine reductase